MLSSIIRWRVPHVASVAFAAASLLAINPASSAQAADLRDIKIFAPSGSWTGGYELLEVADDEGFFAKHGLRADWQHLPWDQYTVALQGGAIDFAPYADYAYFINVFDKGVNAKEVVSSTILFDPRNADDALIVPEGSKIRTAADFRGKRIGTINPSFSGSWFTLDWLSRSGLTKNDVTFVPIPQAQLEQVLQQGGVDAIIAYSPLYAQLQRKGGYNALFRWSDLAGRVIQRGGTMASDAFIQAHPDLVRDYVASIADAADWANLHPADVVKLGITHGQIDADIAPYLYNREGKADYSEIHWAPHGLIKADDVGFWLGVVEREDIVPKNKYKSTDFFTNAFNPYATTKAAD